MTISDRIAVMNRGRIEQLGTPDVVYEHPASVFVAEFLGTSNLLEGKFTGVRDGSGWVDLGDGHVIRIPAETRVREGDRVHVGVRPEKISVNAANTPLDPSVNALDATLLSSVFVGVSYQYFFETRNGRRLSAFDRNAGRGAVATAGDSMCLAWRPEHTFVIRAGSADDKALEDALEAGGGVP